MPVTNIHYFTVSFIPAKMFFKGFTQMSRAAIFLHKIIQKMKFSMKDFFSKCDQIRWKLQIWFTFTEEILNGKLIFLCSTNSDVYLVIQTNTQKPFIMINIVFTLCCIIIKNGQT